MKALVWQDADGVAWLSYNDPRWIAARHGIGASPAVVALAPALGCVREAGDTQPYAQACHCRSAQPSLSARSALAISPTCWPDSLNTAPFSFCSTIARAPTTSAAPAPAPP